MIAFTAPRRPVRRVFVHCSDSDRPEHDTVETIRRWHVRERGWRDIGYTWVVTRDGTLHPGRDPEVVPAAQAGHNANTLAVCLTGRTAFTAAQFDTLRAFAAAVHEQLPLVTFHPHHQVNPEKTCPNFDLRAVLGLNAKGELT